jgi:deoxyribose-phosphate aldolase
MITAENIYALLDLTCLKDEVLPEDIQKLAALAQQWHVAAVCVWPKHLAWLPKDFHIQKASVVNFPHGQQALDVTLKEIKDILQDFPHTEIDYVFDYTAYLKGDTKKVIDDCAQIADFCHQHQAKLKVIVETGAFPDTQTIEQAAKAIIHTGADMLKTSTGKIAQGASLEAVKAFCQAIQSEQKPCGIKISGGIRNMTQAKAYLELIHTYLPHLKEIRIGCSQMVNDL